MNDNLFLTLHNFIFTIIITLLFCNYGGLSNALKSNKLLRIILKVNNINKLLINKTSNQTASSYKSGNYIPKFYVERKIIGGYPIIYDIVYPTFVNALKNENKICKY